MRLPLPGGPNPAPKQAGADTLGEIIDTLLSDLETARATLASASPEPFTMPLADIWLDINMNGAQDKGEGIVELLGETLLGRRAARDFAKSELASTPPAIRFDSADHSWLTAYTHMFSGALNTCRAYDPARVMADLAEARAALANVPQLPEFYDLAALRTELEALRPQFEAARIQAGVAHWREMVRHNRRFWALVEAETDNENEWIPNPKQSSALGLEVSA